jgi:5-methylcytosine-specific restriction endonuclease McrA
LSVTPIKEGLIFRKQVGVKCDYWKEGGEGHKARWRRAREAALKRAGHRCERCGETKNLHVHHKRKPEQGGTDSLRNLIVLCRTCHGKEHPAPEWIANKIKAGKWKPHKPHKPGRKNSISSTEEKGLLERFIDLF